MQYFINNTICSNRTLSDDFPARAPLGLSLPYIRPRTFSSRYTALISRPRRAPPHHCLCAARALFFSLRANNARAEFVISYLVHFLRARNNVKRVREREPRLSKPRKFAMVHFTAPRVTPVCTLRARLFCRGSPCFLPQLLLSLLGGLVVPLLPAREESQLSAP